MMEQKISCVKTYYETKSRLFKQDIEGSSISTIFQTEIRFSSLSKSLKLMTFAKILLRHSGLSGFHQFVARNDEL